MNINLLTPRQSLNKAFLKVKPNRIDIERFKANLIQLLSRTNDTESEEFHKNLVSDFLKKTYYEPNYFINTKGRNDLVIHNGNKADQTVGVIIEAKKPTNKSEMPTQSNLNVKAFHELILYYLRERITHKNLEVRYLIITNINEWYIFNAQDFEKIFAEHKNLVHQFNDFEAARLSGNTTDFFYKEIAEPFIGSLDRDVQFTYFDFRDYEKPLKNADAQDDNKLIALYKLLSPEHLLKLPFANDSNSLDKRFYGELLHIIGLVETREGSKKLIERNKPGARNSGTLLENAIAQLDSTDKLGRIDKPGQFGSNTEERLLNVGLELCITWINRILFLKLLEAQLIRYHKGDKSYAFLDLKKITNYDDLNSLFFQILARRHAERSYDLKGIFDKVPYLNSSLFEPTEIEHTTLLISNLRDDKPIPIYGATVLKDEKGKKRSGELSTLTYLFQFLDAYDFSSEGSEEIQEEDKTLINASVLGLIFEKINGYKDGSYFTPGFITMYMCRESIRRAVVQKFNAAKDWNCTDIESLYDKIEDPKEANQIINTLKICDPAVGSGHFLVSALNEIISIKNDLKILQDRQGKRLKEYHVEVVNDEIIITDEDGDLYEYHPGNKESQRIQEAIFHEKQTIIENCLFGVDINSNSVKICRLRLWIELLKNAYYKSGKELETLPNIDINIKCGNSLINRFDLDADIKQALKKSKWTIHSYQIAIDRYRNAENKEEKHEMLRLINSIKGELRTEIGRSGKTQRQLDALSNELYEKYMTPKLIDVTLTAAAKQKQEKDRKSLEEKIKKLKEQIDDTKNNKIYEDAFEWRFEFPEVLDDNGEYVGFDLVIANPPYIRQEELADLKPYLKSHYTTFSGTADLYVYFVELAFKLLHPEGEFIFILPNKWMRAGYGKGLRDFVKGNAIHQILDFGDLPVFDEATTYPCILQLSKSAATAIFSATNISTLSFRDGLYEYVDQNRMEVNVSELPSVGWTLTNSRVQKLLSKIRSKGIPLGEYVKGNIFYGIKTGLNEAFVIDMETRNRLIAEDSNSEEIIKPFLAGRDIKRYQQPVSDKYLIFTRRGIAIENYPAILRYLEQFKIKLEPKPKDYGDDDWPGRKPGAYKWYEIQDTVDYYKEFDKPKIIWPGISKEITSFALDKLNFYGNDNNQLIISGEKYLLAILNSSVSRFFLQSICDFVRGGFARLKIVYVEQFPVIKVENIIDKLDLLVDQIEFQRRFDQSEDISELESEVDQIVYQIYDLTDEEILIVENNRT